MSSFYLSSLMQFNAGFKPTIMLKEELTHSWMLKYRGNYCFLNEHSLDDSVN